jgi:hypothetical protein
MEAPARSEDEKPNTEEVAAAERSFGSLLEGPETSSQFPGSKIFLFKEADNKKRYYALRRTPSGVLEGNMFSLLVNRDGRPEPFVSTGLHRLDDKNDPDVTLGGVYQMHPPELRRMEALLRANSIEI